MRKLVLLIVGLLLAGELLAGSVNRDDNIVSVSTTTATKVLGSRINRKALSIKNLDSATTIYYSASSISPDSWPATSVKTGVCAIPAGGSYNEEGETAYTREIYIIAQPSATANVNVNITERW